jgi:hypothetical protein
MIISREKDENDISVIYRGQAVGRIPLAAGAILSGIDRRGQLLSRASAAS